MVESPPSALGVWRPSEPPGSRLQRLGRRLGGVSRAIGRRPKVLTIVHAGGGGTIFTNEDLMRALAPTHDCFILGCGPSKWVLSRVDDAIERVEEVKFDDVWSGATAPSPSRLTALATLLARRKFDVVHIRSLLGSGPEVAGLAREAGARVVWSFHDFTVVCPTINLLDADLTYCGGVCTPGEIDCTAPSKWFAGVGRLKSGFVLAWRERVTRALPAAHAFVTTSASAASLLQQHFPHLRDRIEVIEHGRDIAPHAAARPPTAAGPNRVVVLGALGPAKGSALVDALARMNAERGGPFEFHLLGQAEPGLSSGVIRGGAYERERLPDLLTQLAPSFSLIPSLWPETYSHTLTESWAAGIPVLASDLGALGERIRSHGGGWLLDPRDPASWYDTLTACVADPARWREKVHELQHAQPLSLRAMAERYKMVYSAD